MRRKVLERMKAIKWQEKEIHYYVYLSLALVYENLILNILLAYECSSFWYNSN